MAAVVWTHLYETQVTTMGAAFFWFKRLNADTSKMKRSKQDVEHPRVCVWINHVVAAQLCLYNTLKFTAQFCVIEPKLVIHTFVVIDQPTLNCVYHCRSWKSLYGRSFHSTHTHLDLWSLFVYFCVLSSTCVCLKCVPVCHLPAVLSSLWLCSSRPSSFVIFSIIPLSVPSSHPLSFIPQFSFAHFPLFLMSPFITSFSLSSSLSIFQVYSPRVSFPLIPFSHFGIFIFISVSL